MRMAVIFFILLAASIFLVFSLKDYFFLQQDTKIIQKKDLVGQTILDSFNDKSIQLFDFKGNSVNPEQINREIKNKDVTRVFHFWASWCDPCAVELPELIKFAKKMNAGAPLVRNFKWRGDPNNSFSEASKSELQIYLISLDNDYDGLSKFTKIFPEILSKQFVQIWDKNNSLSGRFYIDKLPKTIFVYPDEKIKIHDGIVNWKQLSD